MLINVFFNFSISTSLYLKYLKFYVSFSFSFFFFYGGKLDLVWVESFCFENIIRFSNLFTFSADTGLTFP